MNAALFPGQGIDAGQVLAALDRDHPLTAAASELLGYDLVHRVEQISRQPRRVMPTSLGQPAIFVAGVTSFESALQRGETFDYLLGHSLGEYTALVAGRSISFRHGLALVAARGTAMQRAGARSAGGMAAVLGLDLERVEAIARSRQVTVANDNSPRQVVVSGDPHALTVLADQVRTEGGRCVLLPVEGAFHSTAMLPAADALSRALFTIEIRTPSIPVISNVSARPYRAPGEIRRLLETQLTGRVRFRECALYLLERGVDRFVDVGPGEVVGGIVRSIQRSLPEPVDA